MLATLALHRSGVRLLDGPGAGLAVADHDRFGRGGAGRLRRVRSIVERTAENPVVPFDLFLDRNRLATFAAIFLAGGVMFTADRADRPLRAGHHGLQRAARGRRLHPVRRSRWASGWACRRTWCRGSRRGCW